MSVNEPQVVTVRSDKSITCAPGGRLTDRPILAIRLPSTRICAGSDSSSEEPSNILPDTSTVALRLGPPSVMILVIDSAGFRRRLYGPVRDRKLPASSHGHKPESKAEDCAG